MKKVTTCIIAAVVLTLAGCKAPTGSPLVDPDAAYEIDTWGANSEVYEFTPQTAPGMTCVMLMLDSGRAMGLQCFHKGG